MPIAILYTNLRNDQVPQDLEVTLSKNVAEVLDKPVERVTTLIETDKKMYRNGTSPFCLLRITSIGVFDPERNPGYSEKFIDFLKENLKIPGSSIVVQYLPLDPDYVASGK